MKCTQRGLTLIEVMVVVSIIALVTTALTIRESQVSDQVKLTASASRILEAAKDTRQRSLSVDEFVNGVFPSYGLHFNINNPEEVVVYADCTPDDNDDGTLNNSDDFAYDSGSTDCDGDNGFVRSVSLRSGTFIKEIASTGAFPDTWASATESTMDILYLRPEPTIWVTDSDGNLMSSGFFEVVLSTDNEKTKSVIFSITGSTYVTQ